MEKFDVVVIGGGPGGYVAAIRCSQLGFKTALVEKYKSLGGTCLNVGCIPSKALLDSSEHFHQASHIFSNHGIKLGKIEVDWSKMVQRKDKVIDDTVNGIEYLMKKNKITVIQGIARFNDMKSIVVTGEKGETSISANKFIIATGSKPTQIKGCEFNKDRVISSTEALSLKEIPKNLTIIGAGVIGLEMGSIFVRLGSKVEILEFAPRCVPGMDSQISSDLEKSLKKSGIKFRFNIAVQSAVQNNNKVSITAKEGEKTETIETDYCLVAVGRTPYTSGLDPEKGGLKLDPRGFIETDTHKRTSNPDVYAIGDVTGNPMLAHKAEEEGVFVAEWLAGQKPHLNPNLIPGIVYTWPEAASVGQTEEELKNKSIKYKKGVFPFMALGRARASEDIEGFAKILADAETDEILGVHIFGARASDLIMEVTVAMEYRATAEDLARICHGHPTFSEAIKEAALIATENRPINL